MHFYKKPTAVSLVECGVLKVVRDKNLASLMICILMGLHGQVWAAIPEARQAALRHMLKQDCGSCHGMTLKGGLGPALTVSVIADKPKQLLYTTILNGRPGTPMPPFSSMLTEEEVHWLVELLYKGVI